MIFIQVVSVPEGSFSLESSLIVFLVMWPETGIRGVINSIQTKNSIILPFIFFILPYNMIRNILYLKVIYNINDFN